MSAVIAAAAVVAAIVVAVSCWVDYRKFVKSTQQRKAQKMEALRNSVADQIASEASQYLRQLEEGVKHEG